MSTATQPGEQVVSFPLPAEAVAKLRAQAAHRGLALEAYLRFVTEQTAEGADPTGDEPEDRLEKEIAWLTGRTKEEVEETRRALLNASRPARPVPEGKTLADMVEGKWPGDETDEQVREALDRLS
jgi:hypothetical protein